jgi:prophage regulatory protein
MPIDRILRPRVVVARCGFSRATLYRMIDAGIFPRPQQITPGVTGWRASIIREWLNSRRETRPVAG